MMYGQSYDEGKPRYQGRAHTSELTSFGQCTRYLLIALNIAYWMASCIVIGVTVWILVEKNFMSAIYGNVLMTVAGYLIVIGACLAFFFTLLGCCGAIAKHKVMLLVYCCGLVAIFLFLFVGALLAIVYRTQIRNELQYTVMRKTIEKNYGVNLKNSYNEFITTAWDKAQRKLKCCGVEDQSWNVFRATEWYKIQSGLEEVDKPYVPESCCVTDQYGDYLDLQKCQTWNQGPPGKNSGDENTALYYRGCYNAGRDFIIEFSGYLIGMGMGVGIAMIGGIILSFMLLRMVD